MFLLRCSVDVSVVLQDVDQSCVCCRLGLTGRSTSAAASSYRRTECTWHIPQGFDAVGWVMGRAWKNSAPAILRGSFLRDFKVIWPKLE